MAAVPAYPDWYLNLLADPEVVMQVGAEVFRADAKTAPHVASGCPVPGMVGGRANTHRAILTGRRAGRFDERQ
jgi:hypothetical protein